ncbi:receptor-like protein 12 [Sesamum indicum]|uniref:Receptor-like protein 12 n=1 Tax=Sesamum indicum TaxID=4182 RepID=A0A6I9U7H2_SESIN|nr:receptor-like protein 12 [Sesamum indicum]
MGISLYSQCFFCFICILSIFCITNYFLQNAYSQCLQDQRSLLLQLRNDLIFNSTRSRKLVLWNQTQDCCNWDGVECDGAGRVISLKLDGEGISGGIHNTSSLSALGYLEKLNLAENYFRGQIPGGILNLKHLTHLSLSGAGFGGQVPIEVSLMRRLVTLDLSYNGLEIENPNLKMLLQNLTRLRGLYLDSVQMSSAVLNFFANFSHLTTLSLSGCDLRGSFPNIIFQLPTLENLDLSFNQLLTGSIPQFHRNASLRTMFLLFTNFSGPLPNSIGNLSMLSVIDMRNCSFTGPIPSTISTLTGLIYVDLSWNFFTGSIPSFYMSKNLQLVDLSDNSLSGSIPKSLFGLPSLQILRLSNNQLSGRVYEFSTLHFPHIVALDLSRNKLEGQIPKSFFTLERLETLKLSYNFFNGTVQLGKLQRLHNLVELDLSYNNLSIDTSITNTNLSMFPQLFSLSLASCNLHNFPDLTNQHSLGLLDLSNNRIIGEVPNWIWEIGNGTLVFLDLSSNMLVSLQKPYHFPSSLIHLVLHSNLLQGELPPIPQHANYIDYSNNKFEKSIPLNIGDSITNLRYLSLANNSLSEAIPTSFCNATELEVLDLSSNKLSGSIPPCLVEKVEQLAVLKLGGNNISGHIPNTFSVNCNLEILDMSQNYLEGRLPVSLANCKLLQILDVGNNNIDDGFPCMLPSSLRVLVLRSNKFHGQVRCSRRWTNLQIIDIASNNFTGYLYTKIFSGMMLEKDGRLGSDYIHYNRQLAYVEGYYQGTVKVIVKGVELELVKIFTIFTAIDFSCNNFEGEIPDGIGDLRSLHILNLSHNTFVGTIPKSLSKLTYIESVDLSTNQLTGEIPRELTRLTFLAVLNLSHNQLIGPIPSGPQFQTFSTDSFQGNIGLCGFPLNISCRHVGEEDNVSPPDPHQEDEAINWDYVSVALGYVVGLGSILWLLFFSQSFRHKFNDQTEQAFQKIYNAKNRRKGHRGRTNRRRHC